MNKPTRKEIKLLLEAFRKYLQKDDSMSQNAENITNATGVATIVIEPGTDAARRYAPYEQEPVYFVVDPEQGSSGYVEARFKDAYNTAWHIGKKLDLLPEPEEKAPEVNPDAPWKIK